MRRMLKLLSVLILSTMLTACAKAANGPASGQNSPTSGTAGGQNKPKPGNQGITVNKIAFEEVKADAIPEALKSRIGNFKKQRGFLFEQKDGVFYLAVLAGEKPTGGYSLKVLSVEDNEGKTNVIVEEAAPGSDQIVTQALTYPYVVVKMKGVTDNFVVKNSKGETFTFIKA